MGYMRHDAIIVTSWDEHIEDVHAFAEAIFPYVSPISPPVVNGYRSFFIPPDGSKEGWPDSNDGDERRERFRTFLKARRGKRPHAQWVEVRYADENCSAQVIASSDLEDD